MTLLNGRSSAASLAVWFLLLWAFTSANADTVFSSRHTEFRLEQMADGLKHPWSLAFLPDGSQLITERNGSLRHLVDGKLKPPPIAGLPDYDVAGQGGLLDVLVHPNFEDNQLIFLSYAHGDSQRQLTTRVAKAKFDGQRLTEVDVIFEARPRGNTTRHFAGRMVIDSDGLLYVAVGDRGTRERAQDASDDAGGVHRITIDGEPAPLNPWQGDSNTSPTFFTLGNRNIQGMTVHPQTGEVWAHEHGPRGGDEVNIIRSGSNYGWPLVTFGIGYSGFPISDKTTMPGITDPLHYWDPSIAPSGMAFYNGDLFSGWQGDLFVGALKMRKLVRLRFDGNRVVEEEDLLASLGERIRDVRMGPDGAIWLLTDSGNGKVYRLLPAR